MGLREGSVGEPDTSLGPSVYFTHRMKNKVSVTLALTSSLQPNSKSVSN